MTQRSEALEFKQVRFYIERPDDFMSVDTRNIRSVRELRDTLNEMDMDEDFGIYITGTTEDGHAGHFRFYNRHKEDKPWFWGYVSFVLDKLDSQAEKILGQIKGLVNGYKTKDTDESSS